MSAKLVVRWHHVAPAVLALVLLAVWAAWHASASREGRQEAPPPVESAGLDLEPTPLPAPGSAADVDFPRQSVVLFWPRADGSGLQAVDAEIFATQRVTDQIKQVVELLLRGPLGDDELAPDEPDAPDEPAAPDQPGPGEEPSADAPFLAPLPTGTRLRSAFLDAEGTAYLSLSAELTRGVQGGTDRELTATYSVVNSLVRSLPEVRRVQFLVEGQEIESIGGHLDARYPFTFEESLVAAEPTGT